MQSLMTISDLEVDHIIEKVLIRSNSKPYNYLQLSSKHQSTPNEHIWHYQLQQENVELKNKIKDLKIKFKRKENLFHKHQNLNKEIQLIKGQLEDVLAQNIQIQKDINKLRIRNSHLQESSQRQFEQSIRKSKHKRQCSCESSNYSPNHNRKKKIVTVIDSPIKQQKIKQFQDSSVNCQLLPQNQYKIEIKKKIQSINNLKSLIVNQQRLISSYQSEIDNKKDGKYVSRKNTIESTARLSPLLAPTSLTTFKQQPSAGSIVKIRRTIAL